MEPKLPLQNRGPEYGAPAGLPRIERPAPSFTPEKGGERYVERHERSAENVMEHAQVAPTVLPSPVVQSPTFHPLNNSQAPLNDDIPLVANDEDLIEKEWVDKAKKIVIATKDDPYRREAEVGKLQAEYLKRRYGKELGASE